MLVFSVSQGAWLSPCPGNITDHQAALSPDTVAIRPCQVLRYITGEVAAGGQMAALLFSLLSQFPETTDLLSRFFSPPGPFPRCCQSCFRMKSKYLPGLQSQALPRSLAMGKGSQGPKQGV